MIRAGKIIPAVLLLLYITSVPGIAQVPVRKEQLIYTILAFNGRDYSRTFGGEDASNIYLISNVDNFLGVCKTLVYFWPITGEWKTSLSTLNIPFEGALQILGYGGKLENLKPTPYTFYNVQGEYELNWKVAKGEEAYRVWEHYQGLMSAYLESLRQYQRERNNYRARLDDLTLKITRMRNEGKDVTKYIEMMKELKPPQEPDVPRDYIVPPAPVSRGFIVNLPAGKYRLRFITNEGELMQGSEIGLVIFDRRRAESVGLEVIPGDRWTRPVESKPPASVLYVDGSADLYLRPFFMDEYNDLYYEKMRRNDARGNPALMKWVRIQQIPEARIFILKKGDEPRIVLEEPFFVEQLKGTSLGYKIIPYDPMGAHRDLEPGLIAFHIPLGNEDRIINLRVEDKNGRTLKDGTRQIRVIHASRSGFLLLIFAVLPFIAMTIVFLRRTCIYNS